MFSKLSNFVRQTFRPAAARTRRAPSRPAAPAARLEVPSRDGFSMPLPRPPMRVRSLGTGADEAAIGRVMDALPAPHLAAVQRTLDESFHAVVKRGNLPVHTAWSGAHLIHATYAPGTSRTQAYAGVRGTQLGAAQYVRGRNGHLHVYAMVYTG